jgi:hypothetical protein
VHGRNSSLTFHPVTAALDHQWAAAVSVCALSPGFRKEPKVCRQLLELRGRLVIVEAGHA